MLSNLACVPTPGRPGGAHAKASTRFLTDVSPPTSETWLDAGISMDQIVAKQIGASTQLASLELAVESAETAGACDVGFACAYTNTISWLGAGHAAADGEQSARGVRTAVRRQRQHRSPGAAARIRQDRSVLDSVKDELATLQGAIGAGDRAKLSNTSRRSATSSAASRRPSEQSDRAARFSSSPRASRRPTTITSS